MGCRRKLKYCWQMAAAFGKVRLTNGELARRCRRSLVPPLESKSICDQDIARRRAGPVNLVKRRDAQYLRLCTGVRKTNHDTSRVYLRQVLAWPSQDGTEEMSLLSDMLHHTEREKEKLLRAGR